MSLRRTPFESAYTAEIIGQKGGETQRIFRLSETRMKNCLAGRDAQVGMFVRNLINLLRRRQIK
jgi:hypothetical protein